MPSRKKFEKRVAPALSDVLGENERILVSGFAMLDPGLKMFSLGNLPKLGRVHPYWLVLSDSRLVLIKLGRGPLIGGKPRVQRMEPRNEVSLVEFKSARVNTRLSLVFRGEEYRFVFGPLYKQDAVALATALGGPPEVPLPPG